MCKGVPYSKTEKLWKITDVSKMIGKIISQNQQNAA